MGRNELTLEFVNENFYEIDGKIYRKDNKKYKTGISNNGYYTLYFKRKKYLVHRILWILYNQKSIPEGYFIDHIDSDKCNNKIENLRLATNSQNQHNSKISRNNKLGIKGMCIYTSKSKYTYILSQINKNNKTHKKQFPNTSEGLEQAKLWLEEKRKELHGEFARN